MNSIPSSTQPTELPWYKQFWPWFLIALPGSVVIAAISTAIIAFSGADPLVHDNYYKKGLAINQSNEQVSVARALGIELKIAIAKDMHQDEALVMTLQLSGNYQASHIENGLRNGLKIGLKTSAVNQPDTGLKTKSTHDQIKLHFSHPTIKNRDFVIELDEQPTQLIQLPTKVIGKWHLTVTNQNQTWLLRQSVFLKPDSAIVIK
jgi:hypothetical protein